MFGWQFECMDVARGWVGRVEHVLDGCGMGAATSLASKYIYSVQCAAIGIHRYSHGANTLEFGFTWN